MCKLKVTDNQYLMKVKKFNERSNYIYDIDTVKLFLDYYFNIFPTKKIFVIGTGLGGDIKKINMLKGKKLIGIEPRIIFYENAKKIYQNLNGQIFNLSLGDWISKSKSKLSGIFLFMHSINHIPQNEIKIFKQSIKNSYILIINPNPEIGKIMGKTDKTVYSYLDKNNLEKILNSTTIFDFYYHPIMLKRKRILLREAILLKTNS